MAVLLNSSINLLSGGNSLTWVLIVILLIIQLSFAWDTWKTQKKLKNIFSSKSTAYQLVNENDFNVIKTTHKNEILDEILHSLNYYLEKNKGAANDYHLIKDIVDRHCETYEEKVSAQSPIPLFVGLAGTMFGILIGVLFLVSSGNLEALLKISEPKTMNTEYSIINENNASNIDEPTKKSYNTKLDNEGNKKEDNTNRGADGIIELLGGVGLAMFSSLVGIILAVITSSIGVKSNNTLERNKNVFYSWVQAELLPALSQNSNSAFHLLSSNLRLFNDTFSENTANLDNTLQLINESYKDQAVLIESIDKLEIKEIATANIRVYRELQASTDKISQFNEYLQMVTSYVNRVGELNENLNNHLDRTKAIEDMGVFFKEEITQIEQRKGVINKVVANIDNTLTDSVNDLEEHAFKQIEQYKNALLRNNEVFKQTSSESIELLEKSLSNQEKVHKDAFNNHHKIGEDALKAQLTLSENTIIEQQNIFKEKVDEISSLVEELKDESSINKKISQLVDIAIKQEQSIKAMEGKIDNIDYSPHGNSERKQPLPKWVKISAMSTASLVSLTSLAILIPLLIEWINKLIN